MSEIDGLFAAFKETQSESDSRPGTSEFIHEFMNILDEVSDQLSTFVDDQVAKGIEPDPENMSEIKEIVESAAIRKKHSWDEVNQTFYEALVENFGTEDTARLLENTYRSKDLQHIQRIPLQEQYIELLDRMAEQGDEIAANTAASAAIHNLMRLVRRNIKTAEEYQTSFFKYGNLFVVVRMYVHADDTLIALESLKYILNTL